MPLSPIVAHHSTQSFIKPVEIHSLIDSTQTKALLFKQSAQNPWNYLQLLNA